MKDTLFIFVRHGETDWNKEHRMQGQIDVPLNQAGEAQAQRIGWQLKDFPIDIFYASPQIRAHKTALAIAHHHPHATLQMHSLLKERAFGKIEGASYEDICKTFPTMNFELSWEYPDFQPPDGERIRDVYDRGTKFLTEVLSKHEGKTIGIISHGVTIRCMICYLMNWPIAHNAFFELGNTGLTVIKKRKTGEGELHVINHRKHLS